MNDKEKIVTYCLLICILFIGVLLRTSRLSTLGLGFDEPLHIYPAMALLESGQTTLPSGVDYNRALLFTYTVAASFKVFGVNEFSARLPSVVFGIICIVIVFFMSKRFFGRETALIAAILMAIAPLEIGWSRACRMYSMYQFAFLLSTYCFFRGLEVPSSKNTDLSCELNAMESCLLAPSVTWRMNWIWLVVSGIFFLLAFGLQPQVIIFGLGVFTYCMAMSVITLFALNWKTLLRMKYVYLCMMSGLCIVLAVTIPSIYQYIKHIQEFSPQWSKHMGVYPTRYFLFLSRLDALPLLPFFLIGIIQVCVRISKFGIYCVSISGASLLIHSLFVNVQGERYIYDIYPMILIVSSYAICTIWHNELEEVSGITKRIISLAVATSRLRNLVIVVGVCIFVLFFSITMKTSVQLAKNMPIAVGAEFHAEWRDACNYVKKNFPSATIVVASIPLAAIYSGCKDVEYKLDNGGLEQFRKLENGSGFLGDAFSNAKTIINVEDLKGVIKTNRRGVMLLDKQRFNSPAAVPMEMKQYINKYLSKHSSKADETITIFSWNSAQIENKIE